jgi:heat shock protein HslJ
MLQKPKLDNSVVGKKWTWEATLMNNDEHILPKDRDAFTITFNEDGSFNGTTDCNNFFGQYEREGNKLSFGPIAATRMYCEGSQENEFTSTLSEVDSFMLNEKGNLVLLLKLDSGSIIFQDKYSEYNARKWELIKQAVKDCKVKEAGQTHGRKVSVELKNGQRIEAFEPNIDDIFSIINESEEKCGDVNMWTE